MLPFLRERPDRSAATGHGLGRRAGPTGRRNRLRLSDSLGGISSEPSPSFLLFPPLTIVGNTPETVSRKGTSYPSVSVDFPLIPSTALAVRGAIDTQRLNCRSLPELPGIQTPIPCPASIHDRRQMPAPVRDPPRTRPAVRLFLTPKSLKGILYYLAQIGLSISPKDEGLQA